MASAALAMRPYACFTRSIVQTDPALSTTGSKLDSRPPIGDDFAA